MHWTEILAASFLLASCFAGGQSSNPHASTKTKVAPEIQTHALHVDESVRLEIPAFGMYGTAKSDHDGSIYVLTDATGDHRGAVGLKLNDRGDTVAYKIPEQERSVIDLAVSPSGAVGILSDSRKAPYYAVDLFDTSGQVNSRVTLDVPLHIHPVSILMFDDGKFLLRSYYTSENDKDLQGKPYVVLLDSIGHPEKELSSLDPETRLSETATKMFDGAAVVGDDARIYFAKGETLRVLSETGQLLGKYSIPKPSEKYTVAKVVKAGNRIAIWEVANTEEGPIDLKLAVLDTTTHEPIGFYSPDKKLGTWCFSFTGKSFQFLIQEDGALKLVTADMK